MPRLSDDLPEFGDREALREEMVRIFAAPQFRRSPVMRKLLGFLVAETLAGRGRRLKAYTIAVDALGKPSNFDAQSDAYPRVQVGRLRGLLDAFYAENPPEGDLRFAVPKGGYAVDFGAAADTIENAAIDCDADHAPDCALATMPASANALEAAEEKLRFWRIAASLLGAATLVLALMQLADPVLA